MEIISFDISGRFAHFRKYFTNNTALSFSIPPRTTIMGMLAAICGLPKDSYYEMFSSNNLDIGVDVLSNVKKTIHRLNLLKIERFSDFRGMNGHVQTPFEVVTEEDIKNSIISYRIFLHPLNINKECYSKLKLLIKTKGNIYPLTLGIAGFNAWISNYREYEAHERKADNGFEYFNSAVNADDVLEIKILEEGDGKISIVEEELMPADFVENDNREVKKMNRMLFSISSSPLKARLKETATILELTNDNTKGLIQFMK